MSTKSNGSSRRQNQVQSMRFIIKRKAVEIEGQKEGEVVTATPKAKAKSKGGSQLQAKVP